MHVIVYKVFGTKGKLKGNPSSWLGTREIGNRWTRSAAVNQGTGTGTTPVPFHPPHFPQNISFYHPPMSSATTPSTSSSSAAPLAGHYAYRDRL